MPQFQRINCSYTHSATVTVSTDWPTVHAEPQLVTLTELVMQTELRLYTELKLLIDTKLELQLQIEDNSYTSYDKVTWNKLQLHAGQQLHWPRYTYTDWATVANTKLHLHKPSHTRLHRLRHGCTDWRIVTQTGSQLRRLGYNYREWDTVTYIEPQLHRLNYNCTDQAALAESMVPDLTTDYLVTISICNC